YDNGIPVLDDLVEFGSSAEADGLTETPPELDPEFIEETVHHAMDNIDEKITQELEGLVSILKDSIRDTVLTEIRQQLESEHSELGHRTDTNKNVHKRD
ncbi:MAG: hypothetical protein R3318_02710, partial [Gammaproteobacteria bacterium]|nr:hypothetical protein [Gammaproteobacteria bacterium]